LYYITREQNMAPGPEVEGNNVNLPHDVTLALVGGGLRRRDTLREVRITTKCSDDLRDPQNLIWVSGDFLHGGNTPPPTRPI
jgi:hypothetical protein